MKLKLLMLIGAVAPSFAICAPAAAAESHSNMVVAQAQQNVGEKENDKHRAGVKDKNHPAANKQGQKPVAQQEVKKPEVKKPGMEKPAMKKPVQQQAQKPSPEQAKKLQAQEQSKKLQQMQQEMKKLQTQQDMNKVRQEMKKLPEKPQQAGAGKPQHPAEMQKPMPQLEKNKAQQPVVQTQQHPAVVQGNKRLDQVRAARQETHEGNRTIIREVNRTIIRENGHTIIRHDDTDRFKRGAHDVQVEHRGNQTETIVIRPDGVRVITVVDAQGRLLRRIRRDAGGREVILIDNRYEGPRRPFGFILDLAPPVIHIPRDRYIVEADRADRALLYATLIAPPVMHIERRYTLDEIRYNQALRERMPRIDLDTITFDTGSWEVTPDQARLLEPIAEAMKQAIHRNPNEIFMVEGHTDAVGDEIDNLSLSDHRAEAVAEIMTEDYGIPPENLTTQGYGEKFLKIPTQGPERRNRRVTVRRITPLLMGQSS